jgi:hypothetical protein
MCIRRIVGLLMLLLLLLLFGGVVLARGTPTIKRWVIGGGGGVAAGDGVSIGGALGQAVVGPSGGGSVTLLAGFWTGGPTAFVYLPAMLKNFLSYAEPCSASNRYCEDYDTYQTAYGPLEPDVAYRAYPDDEKDYYYFLVHNPASVTVRVTDYWAIGQVIVRREDLTEIGKDWEDPVNDGILQVVLPGLSPGKYYIQLYTTSGHNQDTPYTLTISE